MEVKHLTQGHTAGKYQSQGVTPACPTPEPMPPKL